MNPSQGSPRRSFLKQLALGATLLSAGPAFTFAADAKKKAPEPLPPGEKALPPTDAVGKALGYVEDANLVDVKKYKKRAGKDGKTQFCDNCQFYQAKNSGWGKCTMLANGLVTAKGWCNSWQKKA
jgi:hypothetical protein